MVTILKESLSIAHRAGVLTCSFFLCLIFALVIIIIPFFLAFSTYNFWTDNDIYTEQPIVLFRNEVIITTYSISKIVSGSEIVSSPSTGFYSTLGELNQLSASYSYPFDFKYAFWDYNTDYKPDMHDMNFTLQVDSRTVKNVKIIANFQYKLRGKIGLDMVTLAIADINTPNGAASIYIDGDLVLKQKNPLKSSKIVRHVYNSTLLDFKNPTENYFGQVFSRYNSRNESTFFNYKSTVIPTGSDSVHISLKIRVPPFQEISYVPLFLENLKFAWIQYLSLLIPVWYLVFLFAKYVYSQQIFETTTELKS